MSFFKKALLTLLALSAGGMALARPVSPGECGVGNVYDPQCTPTCSALGPRDMVPCCAYKILHGAADSSCAAPPPPPAPPPPRA